MSLLRQLLEGVMVLIRIVFVAVIIIMLLPLGPPHSSAVATRQGKSFCERYPMTCGASVELFDAFKLKLGYAITLGQRSVAVLRGEQSSDWPQAASREQERSEFWRRDRPSTEWRDSN